jgi:hypothetical protein
MGMAKKNQLTAMASSAIMACCSHEYHNNYIFSREVDMRTISLLSCIMAVALVGCQSENPVASENNEDAVFPYPGSSPDPLTTEMAVARSHVMPVDPSELGIARRGDEAYTCLWTSGTYYETGTWDWEDVNLDYTVSSEGRLEMETINLLWESAVGIFTSGAAFYYPPDEKKAFNYDLFGTMTFGYLPQWPYFPIVIMVDWSWTGLPHSHGVSVEVDWASAYDFGQGAIPPIDGACGWPLVGNPPPAFTVHGL